MAETKQDDKKKDSRGDEIDMSAHIPEATEKVASKRIDPDDRNMAAKHNELGEGLHPTSVTFGQVVSDNATDAAGNTPEDVASWTERDDSDTSDTKKKK